MHELAVLWDLFKFLLEVAFLERHAAVNGDWSASNACGVGVADIGDDDGRSGKNGFQSETTGVRWSTITNKGCKAMSCACFHSNGYSRGTTATHEASRILLAVRRRMVVFGAGRKTTVKVEVEPQ